MNRVVRNLEKLQQKVKFDAIAFRGMSGAAIAYPVSAIAGYHLIGVRKRRKSHGASVEGSENRNIRRYIIIDDFVGDGATVRAIVRAIEKELSYYDEEDASKCVGIALYAPVSGRNTVRVGKEYIPIFTV